MANIINMYFGSWKKVFNWKDRSPRREFWWVFVINHFIFVLYHLAYLQDFMLLFNLDSLQQVDYLTTMFYTTSPGFVFVNWLAFLFFLCLELVLLSIMARRLNDINFSKLWLLLHLVPLVGQLILLVFMLIGSKKPEDALHTPEV